MWQDALALLIVAVAALALLRNYLPSSFFRCGSRRNGENLAKNTPPTGGCSGCALGSSCAKTLIQARPSAIQQGEQFPAKHL